MVVIKVESAAVIADIADNQPMRKFIITQSGTLEFGDVTYHRDLIPEGEDTCHGGGFWKIDNQTGRILLHGRSFDFGAPEFSCLRSINRSEFPASLGYPIFYQREFCGQEILEPIIID